MAPKAASKSGDKVTAIQVNYCGLEFKVRGAPENEDFQVLDNLTPDNRLVMAFDDGRVDIVQKQQGHWCTMTILKGQLSYFGAERATPNAIPLERYLGVRVNIAEEHAAPVWTFKSTVEGEEAKDHGIKLAQDYPLAKVPKNVAQLRLKITDDIHRWFVNEGARVAHPANTRVGQIRKICTGLVSADPTTKVAKALRSDGDCLRNEHREEQKQLGILKGCRIQTCLSPEDDGDVLVKMYPTQAPAKDLEHAEQYSFDKKLGQTYVMKAPQTFPTDPEPKDGKKIDKATSVMQPHQIYSQASFTWAWKITLIKGKMGLDVPLVGRVENAFAYGNASFVNREELEVSFEPEFVDVLRDRLMARIDEDDKYIRGFLSSTRYHPKIQLRRFYLMERCVDAENLIPGTDDVTLPPDMQQDLNSSQRTAVLSSIKHGISCMWGPPGTGKSSTLANLVKYLILHDQKPEKIIVTGSTNVAVDEALAKAVRVFGSDMEKLMRVYSSAQILEQHHNRDEVLQHPCHIENVCYRLAVKNRGEYIGFLRAVQTLREIGRLEDKELQEAYRKAYKRLARIAMDTTVDVVFCTLATCRSPLLYELKQDDPDKGREYVWRFDATTVIVDEASTVILPYITLVCITFDNQVRLVQAGDPRQLGPHLLLAKSREHFEASNFAARINKGWPTTVLNVEYRASGPMYGHTARVIYPRLNIKSARAMFAGDFGERVKTALPLCFSTDQENYVVPSAKHLINVAGLQQTDGTSSYNLAEATVVTSLVLAIRAAGFADRDIAVLTGYSAQVKVLTREASQHDWSKVRLLTVDSSQGGESQFLIISLVCTTGNTSFMGNKNRANVATSRQREALFFVGRKDFWSDPAQSMGHDAVMGQILKDCHEHAHEISTHPFVVNPQRRIAPSTSSGNPPPPPPPQPPLAGRGRGGSALRSRLSPPPPSQPPQPPLTGRGRGASPSGRGAGQVKTPPRPSTSAPVQTPAPSTPSAPGPATFRTPSLPPPVAPTTPAAPAATSWRTEEPAALMTWAEDAAEKAKFEEYVAEMKKVKQVQLEELRSKYGEVRPQLEMEQDVEWRRVVEFWRKKEEDNEWTRRNRGWD